MCVCLFKCVRSLKNEGLLENFVALVSGAQVFPLAQGEQIGRIFAHWAIVFFGQFFENYEGSPKFRATLPSPKVSFCI
jgi:sulfur relay (sulfurtransferase) DsrC/TusE family protein